MDTLLHRQVDGLVFVNSAQPLDLSRIPSHVSVVVVDRGTEGSHPLSVRVGNDVRLMAHDMTETLIGHGCRRIAYMSITSSPLATERSERYLGYLDALAENGVRLDHDLVLRGNHQMEGRREAYELVDGLLGRHGDIDGIVAMGDRVALGALPALKAHGLEVGRDVSVMGCDNSYLAQIVTPALSSVERHTEAMATKAAHALLAMLATGAPDEGLVLVPHEVVERESTLGR